MTPVLRFQDLNPLGRSIIITVAALTAGIAAVAFLTSYGALYAFIRDAGLYSDRLTRIYPLLLDAAFIGAELAAILFRILRGSRFWSWVTMLLTGSLTVWFNVLHAPNNWGSRAAAALPPVLMMLAFQIDVAIVQAVMRALGRPEQAFRGARFSGYGAGTFPQQGAFGEMPWSAYAESPQNGHGGGGVSKRQIVETYMAQLDPAELPSLTASRVAADLAEVGTPVSERYIADLLGKQPGRNGKGRR